MYLYEKNKKGDSIDVYFTDAKKEDLIEYRRRILERENIDDLFYTIEADNDLWAKGFVLNAPFEFEPNCFNGERISWTSNSEIQVQKDPIDSSKHELHEKLIQQFINGQNDWVPNIYRTRDHSHMYSFLATKGGLVTKGIYIKSCLDICRYEDLINLPPELCTLQLLLHEKFHTIRNVKLDPSEQLDIFSTPVLVGSHSIQKLEDQQQQGLISDDIGTIMEKVYDTEKILEKCKKK